MAFISGRIKINWRGVAALIIILRARCVRRGAGRASSARKTGGWRRQNRRSMVARRRRGGSLALNISAEWWCGIVSCSIGVFLMHASVKWHHRAPQLSVPLAQHPSARQASLRIAQCLAAAARRAAAALVGW